MDGAASRATSGSASRTTRPRRSSTRAWCGRAARTATARRMRASGCARRGPTAAPMSSTTRTCAARAPASSTASCRHTSMRTHGTRARSRHRPRWAGFMIRGSLELGRWRLWHAARRPRSRAEMLASVCRASGAAGLVDTGIARFLRFASGLAQITRAPTVRRIFFLILLVAQFLSNQFTQSPTIHANC